MLPAATNTWMFAALLTLAVRKTTATTEWWGDLRAHMNPPENPPFYDVVYDDNECPFGMQSNAIPNFVYFGEMLASKSTVAHGECLRWCVTNPRCTAINFFEPLSFKENRGMGLCELLAEGQYDNPRLMRPFRKATYYERIHCRRGPDEEDNDAGSSVGARSKGDGAPPPKHGKEDGGKMSSSTMETTQTFPGEIMMPGRRPIISGDSGNDGGHEESERRQPSSQDTESSSSSSTTYVMEESSSTSETAKTDTNDNPEQAGSSTTLETTPDASLAVVEEGMTTESAPGAAEDHQKRESERQQHPSEALDGSKSDGASEAAQRASAFEGNGEPKMGENVGRDGTTVADLPRPTDMESRTTRAADGDFSMMPTTPTSNQQQQNEQQQIIQQMLEENRARLEQIVQRVSQLDAEDAAKKEGHRHTN